MPQGAGGPAWHLRAALNGPVLLPRASPRVPIPGKRVVVTGASSGIGRAAAVRLADRGARVTAVARREPELARLQREIAARGGEAAYRVCDLTRPEEIDELVRSLVEEEGGVDVLVNNAGRSMRRPVDQAVHRLDDFARAMAVNYYGPVQLTMGLLPGMLERREGQVVNVGTWTIPVGTSPRFAAYHSSKAALAGFGRCLGAETASRGVRVTAVHYPLVHTAMSAPSTAYGELPGLTPEQAAGWIVTAIERQPLQIAPRFAHLLRILTPRFRDRIVMRWG